MLVAALQAIAVVKLDVNRALDVSLRTQVGVEMMAAAQIRIKMVDVDRLLRKFSISSDRAIET